MFVVNSQYDTTQLACTLELGCLPPNCSEEQMEFFDQFREVNLLIPTPYRCNALDWPQSVVYYDHSIIHTELATQTYVGISYPL